MDQRERERQADWLRELWSQLEIHGPEGVIFRLDGGPYGSLLPSDEDGTTPLTLNEVHFSEDKIFVDLLPEEEVC